MKLGVMIVAVALETAAPAPVVSELAPGVHRIESPWQSDRGPDGVTLIFEAPDGLIVVDTGRHSWHSDAILAFARARAQPVAAIINTHWHLDHSSGNARLKAAYPQAPLYTTSAVDRALADGGFLRRNYERALQQQAAGEGEPIERDERELFIDTMTHADALRPDIALSAAQRLTIAGRALDVHVTDRAVSDADVWLYDPATRTAVLGDLVTLPAPFFETACPRAWGVELDRVWETPFERAAPGHGAVMTRTQFDTYRTAFNAFVACVEGKAEAERCVAIWTEGIASLEPENARMHQQARDYAAYYVGFLRENAGASPDCLAD